MVSMPQSAFTLCASGQKPVGQTDTVRHRQTDRWACTWVDGAKGQHADVRDGQTGRHMRGLQVHTLSISERFQYSPCLRACVHACACACVRVCACVWSRGDEKKDCENRTLYCSFPRFSRVFSPSGAADVPQPLPRCCDPRPRP